MNRRDIFKLIGGALCAASIELTGVVPRMPKLKVNPAYAEAMFEEVIVFHPAVFGKTMPLPKWINSNGVSKTGVRYNMVDGEMVKVPEVI